MGGVEYHPINVQIAGAVFSAFLIMAVFLLVKARRLQEKYSLVWFAIGIFIFSISVFRGFLEKFSQLMGVYYAPSALFAILISCAYLLLLNVSVSNSTLKKQNKALIQEMGLLKIKLEEMGKQLKDMKEDGG